MPDDPAIIEKLGQITHVFPQNSQITSVLVSDLESISEFFKHQFAKAISFNQAIEQLLVGDKDPYDLTPDEISLLNEAVASATATNPGT